MQENAEGCRNIQYTFPTGAGKMRFIQQVFFAEGQVPVVSRSIAKTEVNKTAFSQPKVGKRLTTCRTGEAAYIALVCFIVGSSTQNIQ